MPPPMRPSMFMPFECYHRAASTFKREGTKAWQAES